MDQLNQIPVLETPETPFSARLAERMQAQNLKQRRMALFLGVNIAELNAWVRGRKHPDRRYWPILEGKGIASQSELQAWKPRRSARRNAHGGRLYSVRLSPRGRGQACVYTLAQAAALPTE